ncbi:MAG: hypothetical protein H6842_00905 [Rhodospirillaceae bacterium]|nr:hypothetical protein [Rhodospirillaceae bacterium]
MTKTRRIPRWSVVALLLAAACATPPTRAYPEIGFAHLPPIRLAVGRIEVVERYRPPGTAPNIDHRLAQPPVAVMRRWAAQRLAAAGGDGVARAIIDDASILEEPVQQSPGLTGLLSVEQSERYTARLAMTIEVDAPGGRGNANAVAERSVTVLEDATLAEIEDAWFRLVESSAGDLDRELEANIRRHLGLFVVQ